MELPPKAKYGTTIWSCNLTPGYISRENHKSKIYMHPSVHCSTTYNSQDMNATQMSAGRWVDRKMWYISTMEYYSAIKKKGCTVFWSIVALQATAIFWGHRKFESSCEVGRTWCSYSFRVVHILIGEGGSPSPMHTRHSHKWGVWVKQHKACGLHW